VRENDIYISRCLDIAKNGIGRVAPNPMVGCIIVHQGEIIGEGYHKDFGGPHAEVNAVNSVKDKDILKESILYVNLEPCSHHGKTPPCVDLIIKMKIPKVVIGSLDPFKEVAGKGILKLKDAGIEVISGILEDECKELNKRFLTFHEKKRPYIILKWAQTIDGYIGTKRNSSLEYKPTWITNENLRNLVHKWRTEEQAIMIGTNTALLDDPQLNAREWKGNDPIRIVLDQNLRLPASIHIFDGAIPTIIFTSSNKVKKVLKNIEYIQIDFKENIALQVCNILYKRQIQSLFIEGGSMLLQTFIDCGLWDEARVFTGNKEFLDGVKAPEIKGKIMSEEYFGNDSLVIMKRNKV
jgi:diaminohydroxyphosphoribosylaminopyrimidine deaminase/5-amino-6-(5-phosphoribosylamino)uracil reductase